MVTHRIPYPPDKGERIRAWHLLKRLSESYDIHLASLADQPIAYETWRQLHAHTTDLALVPTTPFAQRRRSIGSVIRGRTFTQGAFYAPGLHHAIGQWVREYRFDAALAVCSSTAQYVRGLNIPLKVLDLVDVDSRKWADFAASSTGLHRRIYSLESRRLEAYERELAADFHHVLLTTPAEAELYRRIAPSAAISIVCNGVDLNYFTPVVRPHQPVAVFTGVMDYKPNVDGAKWLVEEVWPHVLAEVPEAKLQLVGRDPSPAIGRLAEAPGVELVGAVPDVRPYLADAGVCVAPLHIARGIQNKILEAMSMARPVITTTSAAAAVGAMNGRQLYAVDHPGSWACLLVRLLTDAQASQRMGAAARTFVAEHHAWDRCTQRLMQMMKPPASSVALTARTVPLVKAA
jgi:sugar transferase (PEP-CTERM/EpsH1 system associated)